MTQESERMIHNNRTSALMSVNTVRIDFLQWFIVTGSYIPEE